VGPQGSSAKGSLNPGPGRNLVRDPYRRAAKNMAGASKGYDEQLARAGNGGKKKDKKRVRS